jgi:hypothetical protein
MQGLEELQFFNIYHDDNILNRADARSRYGNSQNGTARPPSHPH